MDKTVESHIPINLRRWLDEQIEREMTDCAPLGFHGLMTALTDMTPEDSSFRLVSQDGDSSLRLVSQDGDSSLRLVSAPDSASYEACFPTRTY